METTEQSGSRSADRWIFWVFVGAGLVLPWGSGVGVKIYLDSQGSPTYPWSDFLDPVALLFVIPLALFWSIPHVALACLWRFVLARRAILGMLYWERLCVALCCFAVGSGVTVHLFTGLFWELDAL